MATTLGERIAFILKEKGYNARRLSLETPLKYQTIRNVLSDRNEPSYTFLLEIIRKFPDVNAYWLLTGKGRWNDPNIQNVPNIDIDGLEVLKEYEFGTAEEKTNLFKDLLYKLNDALKLKNELAKKEEDIQELQKMIISLADTAKKK